MFEIETREAEVGKRGARMRRTTGGSEEMLAKALRGETNFTPFFLLCLQSQRSNLKGMATQTTLVLSETNQFLGWLPGF